MLGVEVFAKGDPQMMKATLTAALILAAAPVSAKNCDRACVTYIRGAVSMAVQSGATPLGPICPPADADFAAFVNDLAYGPTDLSDGPTISYVTGNLRASFPCKE